MSIEHVVQQKSHNTNCSVPEPIFCFILPFLFHKLYDVISFLMLHAFSFGNIDKRAVCHKTAILDQLDGIKYRSGCNHKITNYIVANYDRNMIFNRGAYTMKIKRCKPSNGRRQRLHHHRILYLTTRICRYLFGWVLLM